MGINIKCVECIYFIFLVIFHISSCYKILGIFPYNGRSHHIFFSSLIEELAVRKHDVTVVNNFVMNNYTNLKQITLRNDEKISNVNIEQLQQGLPLIFEDFYRAYDTAIAFKQMANDDCKRVINNKELENVLQSGVKFDLVIAEQFVTDCGLGVAFDLNAPVVGMTAHVLMPWTYSRLGASNHPAFVPNHFFGSGTKPDIWARIKSFIINTSLTLYYRHFIQKSDHEIIREKYSDVPDLEILGRNMSLIMLNQYFPLTGSRLQASNVIEVGGMHIKMINKIEDKELSSFLDSAKNGIVYISFGTVAENFPRQILLEITTTIELHKDVKFIWKIESIKDWNPPENVLLRKWLPQTSILCHRNVLAFISHSGMLSSSEAMHCGVPLISVPLFGDQFANAASAKENGLAVVLDMQTITSTKLKKAIRTVFTEKFQLRAKELSKIWQDRPLSPMDTAIYWMEYVIRHRGVIDMKPPIVDLPIYQYLMLDVISVLVIFTTLNLCVIYKGLQMLRRCKKLGKDDLKQKQK